jgi:predicted alpha/beta hydrolase family esterase
LPSGITGFSPIPRTRLPFPTIVVASQNDPWMSFSRERQLVKDWGAELIDAGNAAHINTVAGYGPWPAGEALLLRLMAADG